MSHNDHSEEPARRFPGLPPPPVTEEEEPARRFPGLPPPPVTEEEEPARRFPGLPPPPVTEEQEPARRFPGLPPPPVTEEQEPARRFPGLPPPPVTEEQEPARQFPGLPPPPVTEAQEPARQFPGLPPPPVTEAQPFSARVAMDDLEAKGLFLMRPPTSRRPQAVSGSSPPADPVGATPRSPTSDWNLFVPLRATDAPPVPTPLARGLGASSRRPGRTQDYRAADLLVDKMAGNIRHERFEDFVRRFEKPVEAPRRALETLFPQGVVRLFDRKDWQALIEGFQRVVPSAPEEPAAWIGLALCALIQKDLKTASALAGHALSLDETLELDRLLNEVLPTHPETWLRLAEELARLGHLEPAMEVCNRVASQLDHPESLRKRAQKARSKVRHDYFLNRGEADPEVSRRNLAPGRALRALGAAILVATCLALAFGAFVNARSTYYLDRGKTHLATGIYLTKSLERRDPIADRRGPVEEHVLAAMADFAQVRRWRPLHVRATFLNSAAADQLMHLGRLRQSTPQRWDRKRWEQARAARDQAHAELEKIDLRPDQQTTEETALEILKLRALRGEGLGY